MSYWSFGSGRSCYFKLYCMSQSHSQMFLRFELYSMLLVQLLICVSSCFGNLLHDGRCLKCYLMSKLNRFLASLWPRLFLMKRFEALAGGDWLSCSFTCRSIGSRTLIFDLNLSVGCSQWQAPLFWLEWVIKTLIRCSEICCLHYALNHISWYW